MPCRRFALLSSCSQSLKRILEAKADIDQSSWGKSQRVLARQLIDPFRQNHARKAFQAAAEDAAAMLAVTA